MLKPVNNAAKSNAHQYLLDSRCGDTCIFCDERRDMCTECDEEWCGTISNDPASV